MLSLVWVVGQSGGVKMNGDEEHDPRPNMYEQVSDKCTNDVIIGTRTVYDLVDQECVDHPPEKPPRRHQRQLSRQDASEGRKCQKMRTGTGDSCVDVDHINLESDKNYKNKYVSVGVQTSPLVPYRLRFWPKGTPTIKYDPTKKGCTKHHLHCCCRTFSQVFLSQIGLTVVLIFWALLGAAAFFYTEGPREQKQTEDLRTLQNNLSLELVAELKQFEQYNQSWTGIVRAYLTAHEKSLLDAVSAGYGEGGGGSIWTYPGCVLFAISLLTTLGFGAPVPRTPLGRGAAVLFAAIGIPLHFLLILNIGNLGAIKLQILAYRNSQTGLPPSSESQPKWIKCFPLIAIASYYVLGVVIFGVARQRGTVECFMFPLDFTAVGGVAQTPGYLRIIYGLYLEFAVMLASLVVSLLQVSASRGIINLGLRLGLLTNT